MDKFSILDVKVAREKFKTHPDSLYDNEVLNLAGVKKSVDLSLTDILNLSLPELISAGFSESEAIIIRSIKELAGRYLAQRMTRRDLLSSPGRVVDFARMKIGGLPHEAFMVIFLNTQNELLGHEIVNEGTVDQVAVYPRRIVEKCLAHHAAGLIVIHNHPSGYTDPSDEDKRLTRSLKEACVLLDIRLLDHMIVGANGYFSFLERGLL